MKKFILTSLCMILMLSASFARIGERASDCEKQKIEVVSADLTDLSVVSADLILSGFYSYQPVDGNFVQLKSEQEMKYTLSFSGGYKQGTRNHIYTNLKKSSAGHKNNNTSRGDGTFLS